MNSSNNTPTTSSHDISTSLDGSSIDYQSFDTGYMSLGFSENLSSSNASNIDPQFPASEDIYQGSPNNSHHSTAGHNSTIASEFELNILDSSSDSSVSSIDYQISDIAEHSLRLYEKLSSSNASNIDPQFTASEDIYQGSPNISYHPTASHNSTLGSEFEFNILDLLTDLSGSSIDDQSVDTGNFSLGLSENLSSSNASNIDPQFITSENIYQGSSKNSFHSTTDHHSTIGEFELNILDLLTDLSDNSIDCQTSDIGEHSLGITEYSSFQVESSGNRRSIACGELSRGFPENITSLQKHGLIWDLSATVDRSRNSGRSGSSNNLPYFMTHHDFGTNFGQSNITLSNNVREKAPTIVFLSSSEGNQCSTATENPEVNLHPSASIRSDLLSSSASATQSIEVFESDRLTSPSSNFSATTDHRYAASGEHPLDLPDSSKNLQKFGEIYECRVSSGVFILVETASEYPKPDEFGKQASGQTAIEKKFSCDYCSFSTKYRTNLKRHMIKMHTGQKVLKCNTCDKKFILLSMLENQERTHRGQIILKCPICGNNLTQFGNQASGQTAIEKKLSCKYCSFSTKWQSSLRKHIIKKHTLGDFKCKTCDEKFTVLSMLEIHERTHTGHIIFECPTCGINFASKYAMILHKIRHTREKNP